MEWGDIILVAVSGLVGVLGAVVGAIVNNHFSRQQMKEIWAEEERRRKSDRRRELYEKDLTTVADTVNALVEVVDRIEWSAGTDLSPDARIELGREAHLLAGRANVMALSLDDQQLDERLHRLIQVYRRWTDLIDLDTGEAYEGTEEEFQEVQEEVRRRASEVLRRRREILEEV